MTFVEGVINGVGPDVEDGAGVFEGVGVEFPPYAGDVLHEVKISVNSITSASGIDHLNIDFFKISISFVLFLLTNILYKKYSIEALN